MAQLAQAPEWFGRKQAADYLVSRGHHCNAQLLAEWASNSNAGNGPSYYRDGWSRVRYKKEDLDIWSEKRLQRVE